MKKIIKNIGKKIITCPSCFQKLRVPIKMGKRLKISCNRCSNEFEIYFENPLGNIFKWDKTKKFGSNIKSILSGLINSPIQIKLLAVLSIIFLVLVYLTFNSKSDHSYLDFKTDEMRGKVKID